MDVNPKKKEKCGEIKSERRLDGLLTTRDICRARFSNRPLSSPLLPTPSIDLIKWKHFLSGNKKKASRFSLTKFVSFFDVV